MWLEVFWLAHAVLAAMPQGAIDSHIHLWTCDNERFPIADGAPSLPTHLAQAGTAEEMHESMTAAGVQGALVVQPINYGQDYSYMEEAARRFPGFFKGMLVADPSAEDPVRALRERVALAPEFWVGVRFNPYKFPDGAMANEAGRLLFAAAGELRMPVGFMPFKGLVEHVGAVEELMKSSPSTPAIIDHWGFFLQPATGFGDDRVLVEESWAHLLRLGREYPQVHVKISGMFRNAADPPPFVGLGSRLEELLEAFGSRRILWGSDAPYFLDFGRYESSLAFQQWPAWDRLDAEQRDAILHRNAERLFGAWGGLRLPQDGTSQEF
mmetsp:Transcript_84176/g.234708  ORF Transcript_84176/g.234708 Transcript_84176/m.234708 type:complete len:324 (+) Transcript_84176:31-1002(+)